MTDSNNNCIETQIMRQVILEAVPPPPRLEDISPYTNTKPSESSPLPPGQVYYTQQQLDMRRKYEILQYKNNGNVNGKVTKKKDFSNLVTNKTRYTKTVKTNNESVIYATNSCPDDETLFVPTSSSDVPGPRTVLYYEPNVPLYNYGQNNLNYAIISDSVEGTRNARINTFSNLVLNLDQFTSVFKLTFLSDNTPNIQITIPTKLMAYGNKINSESDSQIIIEDIECVLQMGKNVLNEQTILSKNIFTMDNTTENAVEIDEIFTILVEKDDLKHSRGNVLTLAMKLIISTENVYMDTVSFIVNGDDMEQIKFT